MAVSAAEQFILTKRKNLLLAARQLAVVRWPYSAPLITTLHDPATGDLVIPDGGWPVGLHAKSDGGSLSNDQTINDIKSHGVGGPTRQIPTERAITLGFTPQETNKTNLEMYWGSDWSDVETDASGGFQGDVSDLPQNNLNRVALIGKDDFNGDPIWLVWTGNRVNIAKTDAQKITDAEVLTYPYTLNFQTEDAIGSPLRVEIFGPGWAAIQAVTDAGFIPSTDS